MNSKGIEPRVGMYVACEWAPLEKKYVMKVNEHMGRR